MCDPGVMVVASNPKCELGIQSDTTTDCMNMRACHSAVHELTIQVHECMMDGTGMRSIMSGDH